MYHPIFLGNKVALDRFEYIMLWIMACWSIKENGTVISIILVIGGYFVTPLEAGQYLDDSILHLNVPYYILNGKKMGQG